jgi:tryptophanyl-tRNA synthetase
MKKESKNSKKILVSAIQSSGNIHIGNYFGAIRQIVNLINTSQYESYIFVADYHSMTTLKDKAARLDSTFNTVATYLACGIKKEKVHIFKQSDIEKVAELGWILNTVTPIPMLFLAHSFKDKAGQSKTEQMNIENLKDINAGLFDYPVLMAADILIYNADIVPVGKDQEQHLEYAREIAGKYNRAYKVNTFKMPKAYIEADMGTVLGIDGNKMAKSKNNQIEVFGSLEIIKKKIMSIKTDSKMPNEKKNPDENNIYNIHKLFLNEVENKRLREKFLNSELIPYSYKEAKEDLYNAFVKYFAEMQKKYDYYTKTAKGKKEIFSIMKSGAKKANKKAEEVMRKVRLDTGLDF